MSRTPPKTAATTETPSAIEVKPLPLGAIACWAEDEEVEVGPELEAAFDPEALDLMLVEVVIVPDVVDVALPENPLLMVDNVVHSEEEAAGRAPGVAASP